MRSVAQMLYAFAQGVALGYVLLPFQGEHPSVSIRVKNMLIHGEHGKHGIVPSAQRTAMTFYEREFPQIIRKLKKINSLKFTVNSWQFTFTPTRPPSGHLFVIYMTSVDKILYCVFMIT